MSGRGVGTGAVLLLLCGAGCGAERSLVADDPDGGRGGEDGEVDAGASPEIPGRPAVGADDCSGRAPQPLDAIWSVTVDGATREFRVHVPASYDPRRATPLVLNFHALGFSAAHQEELSLMTAKADAAGFVVVYPEGTGLPRSWNAGACCAPARVVGVDDVAVVRAVLDDVEAKLCIDARRVYATGMSNGAFLTQRLGCELAERIAAIAPVAGVMGMPVCTPARPVPVMHFHGTADLFVPYDGGGLEGFTPVAESIAGWRERNGCGGGGDAPVVTFAADDVTCETWGECAADAEVTLCTVVDGGHTWPGGTPLVAGGHMTETISATDAMWEFFVRHPRPL